MHCCHLPYQDIVTNIILCFVSLLIMNLLEKIVSMVVFGIMIMDLPIHIKIAEADLESAATSTKESLK